VSCLNGIIAELIAACTLELPFNSIPALKVSSPGECIKFKPDDLSFERRSDMRFEYAHYKKGGNMDLKTATLASLVHKFKTDGFTTLLAQIKDGVWWTDSQRESRFSFEYASTTRRMQSTRCVMVYGRTM
jgi:hypothetical protein